MTAASVQTCLWFESGAEEAARCYVGLLPGSRITHVFPRRGDPQGRAHVVHVDLMGQRYSLLNGGPHFRLSPASSIEVHLETQAEVDRLWDALLDGGTAMRCGWLTDRWGVSWQIIPRALMRLLQSPDDAVGGRVMAAMMEMIKLDGPALEAAARG
jgi:predicted 3-demethylubiquinone-9 3-methyltransferase (glyoxalase superfamily)